MIKVSFNQTLVSDVAQNGMLVVLAKPSICARSPYVVKFKMVRSLVFLLIYDFQQHTFITGKRIKAQSSHLINQPSRKMQQVK